MKRTRFVALALVLLLFPMMGATCKEATVPTADQQAAKATASAMDEAFAQIGMPAIVNFQEKKMAKLIFELRDQEKMICWAYFKSLDGHLVFFRKCLGYGLPYSVQYTNPEKVVHRNKHNGGSFGKLPQPDPNGLFMPEGLSATWLMVLDDKDQPHIVYVEPEIVVSPFKLH